MTEQIEDIVTYCPTCGTLHLDVGEWRDRPHRTHLCLHCGTTFGELKMFQESTRGIVEESLWEDLKSALAGKNGYGGAVAEIYAYRLVSDGIAKANVPGFAEIAARNLTIILREFKTQHPECRLGLETFHDGKWSFVEIDLEKGILPFDWRIHVEVIRAPAAKPDYSKYTFVGISGQNGDYLTTPKGDMRYWVESDFSGQEIQTHADCTVAIADNQKSIRYERIREAIHDWMSAALDIEILEGASWHLAEEDLDKIIEAVGEPALAREVLRLTEENAQALAEIIPAMPGGGDVLHDGQHYGTIVGKIRKLVRVYSKSLEENERLKTACATMRNSAQAELAEADGVLAEVERLREENERLKSAYDACLVEAKRCATGWDEYNLKLAAARRELTAREKDLENLPGALAAVEGLKSQVAFLKHEASQRCELGAALEKKVKTTEAEVERLRNVIGQYVKTVDMQRDVLRELRVELAETQRERNRNRGYVGEAVTIFEQLYREGYLPAFNASRAFTHVLRELERLRAMAIEVGK